MAASSSSSSLSSYEPEIDQEIWEAFAGNLVDIPKKDSLVYYFPQGHIEHVQDNPNPNPNPSPSPNPNPNPIRCGSFLCRVMNVSFLANPETDQAFVKFLLQPCITDNPNPNPNPDLNPDPNPYLPTTSLRDTIFTRIPTTESQNIMLTDIMLDSTKLKKSFVEAKKLTPRDSFVFIRKNSSNDEYYIGIRRAVVNTGISIEDINDAVEKARNMESFEIVYYPIRGLSEFVVPKIKVDNAQRIGWRREMSVTFWHEFWAYVVPIKCRHTGTVLNIVHHENDVSNWPSSWWRVL
ncbi:unnamed protein product [Amaranthus hypochondriacus]